MKLNIEFGNWLPSFSPETDSFYKSFMREALTNALKHGHATAITIICWMTNEHAIMSITNNGEGTGKPIIRGIGISAMEDLAAKQNGTITIQNGAWGFKISAAIPYHV